MSQPWHDLPNAVLIDRILEDMEANGHAWARPTVDFAARQVARSAAWQLAMSESKASAYTAASRASWGSARSAILALVAWDDCAHLLDTDPDQVQVLALLGQPAAILLYPACRALKSSIKSKTYST